jgi:hypothetical protein
LCTTALFKAERGKYPLGLAYVSYTPDLYFSTTVIIVEVDNINAQKYIEEIDHFV